MDGGRGGVRREARGAHRGHVPPRARDAPDNLYEHYNLELLPRLSVSRTERPLDFGEGSSFTLQKVEERRAQRPQFWTPPGEAIAAPDGKRCTVSPAETVSDGTENSEDGTVSTVFSSV